jgi:cytochrome c-type biogenesis protein CcmH
MTGPRGYLGRGVGVFVIAVVAAVAALAISGLGGRTPTDQERATRIASGLRCPVCTDLSAADSSAPLARQMRVEILQQVQDGRTDDEIRAGFVAGYGPAVLLSPPAQGIGTLAHLIPWLVLTVALLGGAGVVVRGRRAGQRELLAEPGEGSAGRPARDPRPERDAEVDNRALVDRALAELMREER